MENTNFVGRVSLTLNLQELKLNEISNFWDEKKLRMGSLEKLLILSVTGGIPKYIEEALTTSTAEKNVMTMCFNKSGILYNDYKNIFKDIFGRRFSSLDKIVRLCANKNLTPTELAKKLKTNFNSDFSEHLNVLDLAGFISRDYYFNPDGKASKLGHVRLKDNYLRFYLKYIEPAKAKIEKGAKTFKSFSSIIGYESILGMQFENLILSSRELIHPILNITPEQIISSAPYRQNKTTINKGACQVDLLVHTSR